MGIKEKDKSKVRRYLCTEYAETELPRVKEFFGAFIEKYDSDYKKKFDFIVSCAGLNDYFKVRILPVNGFDSVEYFEKNFGEMPGKGKLEKFTSRNNIKEFVHGMNGVATNVDRINLLK